jgi:uncharacterized protein with HEPN domain
MYEKKNLTYILTALESIEKIFIYTKGIKDADDFFKLADQLNFNACQILLLVIGEECKKIEKELKDENPEIPWHLIAGLRNRIAHDYRSIDPNISFDIIRNYLPDLKEELIKMLEKVDFEKELLESSKNSFL